MKWAGGRESGLEDGVKDGDAVHHRAIRGGSL